ncbi:fibronectin type III domain-containing protein [Flavobacterium faecale]|uniref:fibronectin type III domain-containing protein n=1 Tax=Flavobacterium faecale TaxID=1355330 RepID=UPI003AB05AB3
MKKTYLYLVVILGFMVSCGGGDDNAIEETPENRPPSVPVQVYPLNQTLCINNFVDFQWNKSQDLDNDLLSYKVEISENSGFTSIVQTKTVTALSTTMSLDKGKVFYWRVKAIDTKNAQSDFSSANQFLTEGEGVTNHLPFSPDLITPVHDGIIDGTSTSLRWSASDVDNDSLTFDVYLDTASTPLTKVSENQTGTTYNASNLIAATTYYFKVVVKDGKGGETIGQVWSFSTK